MKKILQQPGNAYTAEQMELINSIAEKFRYQSAFPNLIKAARETWEGTNFDELIRQRKKTYRIPKSNKAGVSDMAIDNAEVSSIDVDSSRSCTS